MAISGLKQGATLNNGNYRIDGVLGQGSFGITYLATAKFVSEGKLGKMEVEAKVAIKEFFMGEVNSRKEGTSEVEGSTGNVFTNYRRKFRKEAENLSKLSNPNIVKVLDVFDENHTTYYVMEFVEGLNLDEYISDKGAIPENEAKTLLKEIGKALEYMHSQKMLHLDLKPKNIMLRNDGKPCLIDFGLSKQFTEGGEPESSTSIGLGTPGYSPIEQASYKQTGKFPATLDVYALGATLFKMLTGRRPPEATSILNEGFPEEELLTMGISRQTVNALRRGMAPIQKQRTSTVKAFIDAVCSEEEETVVIDDTPKPDTTDNSNDVTVVPTPPEPPEPTTGSSESESSDPGPFEPESSESESKSYKGAITTILIVLGSALTVVMLWWFFIKKPQKETGRKGSATELVSDSVPTTGYNVKEIVVQNVTDMPWKFQFGQSNYTGEVIDDPEHAGKKIPHGKGVAKFLEEGAGSSYEGNFNHGVMEGRGTYTYPNGDTFIGRFKNDTFESGRYKNKSTGQYFEGTWVNGQADKGNWYDKNGNKIKTIR